MLNKFLHHEASGGILLVISTIMALIFANSFLGEFYQSFLHLKFSIGFEGANISKHLILWVNDGLMAIFFFLIGLELKREMLEGELSNLSQVALPAIAAFGGVVAPAIIFVIFNHDSALAIKGWAIPTATDIAFALGVLSLLGSRINASLKIFLMTLAVIDDLIAVLIIAFFYSSDLSAISLFVASVTLLVLFILNYLGIQRRSLYIVLSVLLWVSVLKSGVHATLAGVIAAFFIPLKDKKNPRNSMLKDFENGLHLYVTFLVLPLFAFVNAGVFLGDVSFKDLFNPVFFGIFFGLVLGKQLGVFILSFLAIKLKLASLPSGSSWLQLYGVSVVTGIGFTMSIFIDGLAYNDSDAFLHTDKLAILLGSLCAAVLGFLILYFTKQKPIKN